MAKVEVVVNTPKKKGLKPIETPKAPELPEGVFRAKEGTYKCIKKCYYGISLYKEGDTYEATEGELLAKKVFQKVRRVVKD